MNICMQACVILWRNSLSYSSLNKFWISLLAAAAAAPRMS